MKAFWARVRQGLTIIFDRRRYFREVWLVQFGGWCFRFAAFWFLLDAFHIGGSVRNVLLVLGVNAVAAVVPFTPGGAGVQQAFLVKVFAGTAPGRRSPPTPSASRSRSPCSASRSASPRWSTIFEFRSFKEVIAAGREHREAERTRRRRAGRRRLQ